MASREQDIKLANDIQQLVVLRGIVSSSIDGFVKKTGSKGLEEKIKNFKDTMNLLIDLIFANGVESNHLSRYLYIMIYYILSSKEEDFAEFTRSNFKNEPEQIIKNMVIVYNLCQDRDFTMAMCDIQEEYKTNCIINTEAPAYDLRRKLQICQLQLSQKDDSEQSKIAQEQIRKIEDYIETVETYTKDTREFCEQYKVTLKKTPNTEQPSAERERIFFSY